MRDESETPRTDAGVIEWAPFRLVDGADEQALLAAADAIQRDFLERQRGFVRRELLCGADGQWVDFLVWSDDASAMAAMQAAASSPTCRAYFRLMVGGDTMEAEGSVLHLHRIRVYEPDQANRS